MRCSGRLLPFVFFALSASLMAQSNPLSSSVKTARGREINITGTAGYGYSQTFGNFDIHGKNLCLHQALPDGPSGKYTNNVKALQRLAGHSRIETTARYLHPEESEMDRIASFAQRAREEGAAEALRQNSPCNFPCNQLSLPNEGL